MQKHNFIRDDIELDVSKLPRDMQSVIKGLETYDENFYCFIIHY